VERLIALADQAGPELRELSQRLGSRPFGEIAFFVAESIPRWLTRMDKSAILVVEGRTTAVPGSLANVLSGVLAHLVRNAIAHGIESAEERVARGKTPQATLVLECREEARGVCIEVRDDGVGFDLDALKRSASTQGIDSETDALELAFVQGVTSRGQANDAAGHGVGLAAVRSELRTVGYEIMITSRPLEGTSVTLSPSTRALEVAS
jgi:chemotaxis protein histidine kinase CheA